MLLQLNATFPCKSVIRRFPFNFCFMSCTYIRRDWPSEAFQNQLMWLEMALAKKAVAWPMSLQVLVYGHVCLSLIGWSLLHPVLWVARPSAHWFCTVDSSLSIEPDACCAYAPLYCRLIQSAIDACQILRTAKKAWPCFLNVCISSMPQDARPCPQIGCKGADCCRAGYALHL